MILTDLGDFGWFWQIWVILANLGVFYVKWRIFVKNDKKWQNGQKGAQFWEGFSKQNVDKLVTYDVIYLELGLEIWPKSRKKVKFRVADFGILA